MCGVRHGAKGPVHVRAEGEERRDAVRRAGRERRARRAAVREQEPQQRAAQRGLERRQRRRRRHARRRVDCAGGRAVAQARGERLACIRAGLGLGMGRARGDMRRCGRAGRARALRRAEGGGRAPGLRAAATAVAAPARLCVLGRAPWREQRARREDLRDAQPVPRGRGSEQRGAADGRERAGQRAECGGVGGEPAQPVGGAASARAAAAGQRLGPAGAEPAGQLGGRRVLLVRAEQRHLRSRAGLRAARRGPARAARGADPEGRALGELGERKPGLHELAREVPRVRAGVRPGATRVSRGAGAQPAHLRVARLERAREVGVLRAQLIALLSHPGGEQLHLGGAVLGLEELVLERAQLPLRAVLLPRVLLLQLARRLEEALRDPCLRRRHCSLKTAVAAWLF